MTWSFERCRMEIADGEMIQRTGGKVLTPASGTDIKNAGRPTRGGLANSAILLVGEMTEDGRTERMERTVTPSATSSRRDSETVSGCSFTAG